MRNFTRLCVFLLFISCCWSGCGDRSVRHRMLEAEARFDTVPSDIFRLLSEVGSPDSLSSEDRALYDLLTLRSYSIGGKPLPDSLVRHVYAYYHATDDSLHRARASLYMSRLHYKSRSHFRQWLLPLLEAERYAPADNLLLRGQISSDMGAVYEMQYEDELAFDKYRRAYEIFKRLGRLDLQVRAAGRTGYVHFYLHRYDSARYYFREGFRISGILRDTAMLSNFEYSIGNVFKYENRLDSAYDYFNRAIAWSRDTTPEMRLLLADVYLEQNEVLDARRTLLKGLSVFKRRKDTAKICGAYLVLRQIEEKAGNREFALVAADSAHRYKDFLTDFVQENLISEIRKDSDNLQLAGERNRLLLQRRNLWLVLSLCLAALLGGLCLYFVAVSRRDRRILQAESDRRRQENETQRVRLQLQGETISRQQTELRLERMRSKLGESRQLLLRHLEVQRHISELKRAGEQEDDLDGQQVARLIDRFSLTPNSWPELARIIDQIYDDLPVGLSEVYPQLSVDDVRLCCMIIVGLSSSEIAQVLDIRTESVYRKRRRLKKKLSLGEKDSLREHLLRFIDRMADDPRAV